VTDGRLLARREAISNLRRGGGGRGGRGRR